MAPPGQNAAMIADAFVRVSA